MHRHCCELFSPSRASSLSALHAFSSLGMGAAASAGFLSQRLGGFVRTRSAWRSARPITAYEKSPEQCTLHTKPSCCTAASVSRGSGRLAQTSIYELGASPHWTGPVCNSWQFSPGWLGETAVLSELSRGMAAERGACLAHSTCAPSVNRPPSSPGGQKSVLLLPPWKSIWPSCLCTTMQLRASRRHRQSYPPPQHVGSRASVGLSFRVAGCTAGKPQASQSRILALLLPSKACRPSTVDCRLPTVGCCLDPCLLAVLLNFRIATGRPLRNLRDYGAIRTWSYFGTLGVLHSKLADLHLESGHVLDTLCLSWSEQSGRLQTV